MLTGTDSLPSVPYLCWVLFQHAVVAAGFQHNHARADGPALWGHGTYYATRPGLAMSYAHSLASSDEGITNNLHPFASLAGLEQILAVDVLVGKTKELAQDTTLRMAPLLEDETVGK